MRIGIFLSTLGGSPLQGGMERGLSQLGHHVEPYQPNMPYDLILVFCQVAHNPNYHYPTFPGNATPIAFIDSSETGYFNRLPDRVHKYANCFTETAMRHDTKNYAQQCELKRFLEGRSFPYFIREMSNYVQYPACYHPIDYPLYYQSVCQKKPDREEYLRRTDDIFVSWGASHPWRWPITHALRGCGVKGDILVLEENGHPRMPQFGAGGYFERTEAAKCSVSFDGYGSGSFRMTEVLCRTLLLQGPLSIKTRCPLVHGETCLEYNVHAAGEDFLSTDIAEVLDMALRYPERSFEIYRNGYEHVNTHLTEKATARYVLDAVIAHDYSQPTPLEIA